MSDANVVLTGFMGTGKTTVGRLLASQLGRTFVDTDERIVARAGRSIPDLFAERGETGFRDLEAAVCRELAQCSGLVIATGGGALLDADVRAAFSSTGRVVCLTCDVDEMLRRIGQDVDRPLLDAAPDARREEINRLLAERAAVYDALPLHIDTTGRSPDATADAILDLLDEVMIPVRHDSGSYDVRVGLGALDRLGRALRDAGVELSSPVAVVTNPVVYEHYGEAARSSLRAAGYRAEICRVPDGEQHKRLGTIERLYEDLLDLGFHRRGVVIGLGGGVTTDIAGFAAATLFRGVRVIQVPTTLLAMVDAAVGGKTGVDHARGKNLIGAFWQPMLVMIDPRVLRTLPEAELRCGVAETIKHGVLGDPELFHALSSGPGGPSDWWSNGAVQRIARAVRVKIDVIEEDPGECGRRATLNLGHTVGHAIEATSRYTIRHGEAVAIGLVAAARISRALGRADGGLVSTIEEALTRWKLPTRCPDVAVDGLMAAMCHDKKRTSAGLTWILPHVIGEVSMMSDVPEAIVYRVLTEMGARSEA